MIRRAGAAALAFLLTSLCICAAGSSAFPVRAPPLLVERSSPAIRQIGWNCRVHRCGLRAEQRIRTTGRQSFQEFLAQLTPYLNCCHPSTVPFYGYSYGPEISFDYDHRTSIVSRAGSEWR